MEKLSKNEMKYVLGGAAAVASSTTCSLTCSNGKVISITCKTCGCKSMTTYVNCTGGEGCNERKDCEGATSSIAISVTPIASVAFSSLKMNQIYLKKKLWKSLICQKMK